MASLPPLLTAEPFEATLRIREIITMNGRIGELEEAVRKRKIKIQRQAVEITGLQLEKTELEAIADSMKNSVTYHDNPHTPSSNNSLSGRTRQKARKKPAAEHKKPGREKGHPGVSDTTKSDETVKHMQECCKCKSTNSTHVETKTKHVL